MTDIITHIVTQNPVSALCMLALLGLSGVFSSCETGLFSLSVPQLNALRAGSGRLDSIILSLHGSLKSLLPAILFSNMAVNIMIFSLAASIGASLGARFNQGVEFLFSLVVLLLVVFFGEVFPKQMAIASTVMVVRITVLPVWAMYRAIRRPMRVLNALVSALERAVQPGRANMQEVREEELHLLMEMSRDEGVISNDEYELIDGVVELPDVRVRDVMTARVDAAPIGPDASLAEAVAAARACGHCKLPVLDPELDEISGWVDVRDIYLYCGGEPGPDDGAIDSFVRTFVFFSEHDRADQVLERIKGTPGGFFAVVDERGQLTGFFTLQDIMDEVLGDFDDSPAEVRRADGTWIIPGSLSVREWRELFDVSDAIPRCATVGGLVTALLGRMARTGDRVRLENMEMTVRSTRRNRVGEVSLRLVEGA